MTGHPISRRQPSGSIPDNVNTFSPEPLFPAEVDWLLNSPVLMQPSAHPAILSYPLENLPSDGVNSHKMGADAGFKDRFQTLLFKRRTTRLGIRYETLWQCLYRELPEYQVLATNLQVQDEGRTIGEYDIIYSIPTTEQFFHLELAIKFYLGTPGSTGDWYDWLGPDKVDQLGRKMKLMFDRQIKLSDTAPGRTVLQSLPRADHIINWHKEILLQGYLFYPWQHPCEPPAHANPEHLRGDWLTVSQLSEYLTHKPCQSFQIPPRQQWMGLQGLNTSTETMISAKQLQEEISARSTTRNDRPLRPILVMSFPEGSPFMVTPDDWLTEASSHSNTQ